MEDIVDSNSINSLEHRKHRLLVVMISLSGTFGVLYSLFEPFSGLMNILSLLDMISFVFCLQWWCAMDAQLHGIRLSRTLRWSIILMAFIGFPIYAFRSRAQLGWKLLGQNVIFLIVMVAFNVFMKRVTDLIIMRLIS